MLNPSHPGGIYATHVRTLQLQYEQVTVTVVVLLLVDLCNFQKLMYVQTQHSLQGAFTSLKVSLGTRPSEKIEKRVWEIGWGGSVHCARNAGTLPINS